MGGMLKDLFGNEIDPAAPLDEEGMRERKRAQRRAREKPRGYARPPGTGPEGETCGSCRFHRIIEHAKRYHKCELIKAKWSRSSRTDIRVRSPACEKWEKKPTP